MAAIFELDQFEKLPLWAQVLIASRMVRRGMLAMLPDASDDARITVENACNAIDWCAEHGGYTRQVEKQLDAGFDFRDKRLTRDRRAIAEAIHCAVDACRAAEAAMDFPIDATVTGSCRRAIAALAEDGRVNSLQLTILFAADFDQVRFACSEVQIQQYNGVTQHVLGRLAPVHAIDLQEPKRSAEDDYR